MGYLFVTDEITYFIESMYLNFYENGEMWAPNHIHEDTHQMIISLGERKE